MKTKLGRMQPNFRLVADFTIGNQIGDINFACNISFLS